MVAISSLVLAAIIATGAIAAPSGKDGNLLGLEKRQNTPPSQGTHSGYFYSWWTDLQSPATYENLPGGSYRVRWQSGGNLIGGKGWNTGPANRYVDIPPSMTFGTTANARRTIRFNGTFEADGDSYLAVYGCKAIPPTTRCQIYPSI
jgi:endo-1,4-beta-xylanase